MRMPAALRSLDDRVIGRRRGRPVVTNEDHDGDEVQTRVVERSGSGSGSPPGGSSGDGFREFLTVFARISRLVLLLLVLVLVVGIVFLLTPTNPDNDLVSLVADVSERVAGPFRDVFTLEDDERERMVNYGFAAVVYLIAAQLVAKLPGTKK